MSGRVGLWDTGGLLWLVRLPGDLSGVLLHLLPHIEQPIREGSQDDVTDSVAWRRSSFVLERQNFIVHV